MEQFAVIKEMYAMLFAFIERVLAVFDLTFEDLKDKFTAKDAE